MIRINDEFKQLIPPLTAEEYAGLEKSILEEGCRDALVLWGNVLIDGHNRYEICMKHDIPFETVKKEFDSRDDAILWMLNNQLARRNLNDLQHIDIVRKCADAIKAKARERQISSLKQNTDTVREKFPEREEPMRANDELGAMAGVSGKTYEHGVRVLEEAPKPVVEAALRNDLSINMAHQVTKLEPEKKQEIAERIQNIQNEPEETKTPKAIVQEVLKRPENQNVTLAKALQELSAFERKYSTIKELKPVFDAINGLTLT